MLVRRLFHPYSIHHDQHRAPFYLTQLYTIIFELSIFCSISCVHSWFPSKMPKQTFEPTKIGGEEYCNGCDSSGPPHPLRCAHTQGRSGYCSNFRFEAFQFCFGCLQWERNKSSTTTTITMGHGHSSQSTAVPPATTQGYQPQAFVQGGQEYQQHSAGAIPYRVLEGGHFLQGRGDAASTTYAQLDDGTWYSQ